MRTAYLLIGEVVRPQGVRGELKLRADSQDPARYARLETVYLLEDGRYLPRKVLSGRAQGGFAYLRLEGVNDRDAAEALRGCAVYVDRAHALELPEGEHFICDLIGRTAVTDEGETIGKLTDVLQTNPACDVYAFQTPRGLMMMPALKRAILQVDLDAEQMVLSAGALREVAVWEDEPAPRDE